MKRWLVKIKLDRSIRIILPIFLTIGMSIACISNQPSPAQQQIDQASTMVSNLTSDADKAISMGDYYVAAINLLSLLGNPGIELKLASISSYVPGGLLIQGDPPAFMSFTSRDTQPLPNWPQTASKLLGITLDGNRGVVNEDYNNVASFFIDFATGELTRLESIDPHPSPDLKWMILTDLYTGAIAHNVETDEQIPLCSPWSSPYHWSRDSSKVVAIDGTEQIVFIIEIPSGICNQVKLPGLDWDTEVMVSPDNQLLIILPGSYGAQKKGQLLVANIDGTGIKKIADLPFMGRSVDSKALISPDGSAIYIEGFMVSTRTGNYAQTLFPAIAWLNNGPPAPSSRKVEIIVDPQQGPRGTRFSFSLTGGLGGQEITWLVSKTPDMEQGASCNTIILDGSGKMNDLQMQFGFDTGITTEAGVYYFLVYIGNVKISSATFTVTEP